jgi:gluconolactonase
MKTTFHDPLELNVIGSGLGCPEGPVICEDGSVLCVDIDSGRVLRIADGVVSTVAKPGGGPNGLAIGPDGLGYVANNGGFLWTEIAGIRLPMDLATHSNEPPDFEGGWIESVDLTTGDVTVLARSCGAHRLTGPNDLIFDEAGGLWFTDHGKLRPRDVDRGGLYYLPPDGEVQEIAYPLLGPNGVGLSPDGRTVYIAETMTGRVWAWDLVGPGQVDPAGATLAVPHGGRCLVATPFTLDSLAVEEDGRIAIGGIGDGIVVVTPDGAEVDVYPIPGDVTTNIAFGGPDGRRAVMSLSGSGQIAESTWPRPGLKLPYN